MAVFYGVAKGRKIGIFTTWEECEAQVEDYDGAWFQKCQTREEAEKFVKDPESYEAKSFSNSVPNSKNMLTPSKSGHNAAERNNLTALPFNESCAGTAGRSAGAPRSGKNEQTYYVVAKGKIPGIYWRWQEAKDHGKGYSQKFNNLEDAKLFYVKNCK